MRPSPTCWRSSIIGPFRKREGSRASLFAELDRPALQPLPAERYVLAHWKTVRASIDYHVEVDRHYYSVPYQLAGQKLEARYTAATVEIFHGGKRVASHARSSVAYRHTTVAEHMPKSHQAHLEWTPSRLIHWAEGDRRRHRRSGPHHPGAANRIPRWVTAPASASCVWRRPTPERGWKPPASAPSNSRPVSYQSLKSILKRSLDRQLLLEPEAAQARSTA